MTLSIYAKTEQVIFLFGIKNEQGVMHFPSPQKLFPGLHFYNEPRTLISDQLFKQAAAVLAVPDVVGKLTMFDGFCGQVLLENGQEAALYVGFLNESRAVASDWLPLPVLLKGMKQDKNRIEYVKCWQVLTGSLKLDTRATFS
jgi:hypothetical protein